LGDLPDFTVRMKKSFGEKKLKVSAAGLLAEGKEDRF